MSETVICVENLSKQYTIAAAPPSYRTLRDQIAGGVSSLFQRNGKNKSQNNCFWALKDVSFEVKRGEVLGIIGRNGAGKSTLLKILSRITEPTTGCAKIYGRVGTLLEVGTGFHPELSGRENIYLNGAVLGMKHAEVGRKFDEIVSFAEIEKFIDTPVKHYSSGMYMRLAFAVAAHLEPEILLVDEVLAVGDAAFQKKCLGKMGEVAEKRGRTVIFVSHNMAAIEKVCRRGIILRAGRIDFTGTQNESIGRYLTSVLAGDDLHNCDRAGSGEVRVVAVELRDLDGNTLKCVQSGQSFDIRLSFETRNHRDQKNIVVGLAVRTQLGSPVFLQHNRLSGEEFSEFPPSGVIVCRIAELPLPASTYLLSFSVIADGGRGEYLDVLEDALELTVVEGNFYGSGEVPPVSHGVCLVRAHWRVETANNIQMAEDSVHTEAN